MYNSFHIGVNDKTQGVFRKMDILLTLLLSPLANTNGSDQTVAWFKQALDSEKDVLYRFMNDCRLRWRSIVYEINSTLISCMSVSKPSDACLILDDTDLKKTGLTIELVSRVWSHVDNRALLGFKGLFLGWCDNKSFLALDFSLHREAGKNEKFPFGLKPQQVQTQYHKERPSKCAGSKRALEADQKTTDTGMSMIRRAIFRGVPFRYVLTDSWFVSSKMIKFVLGLPAKRIRKLNMRCIQVNGNVQEVPVCPFFYRNTGKGPWHFLVSTDLDLTPLKAYQLYAKRWNIEVLQRS